MCTMAGTVAQFRVTVQLQAHLTSAFVCGVSHKVAAKKVRSPLQSVSCGRELSSMRHLARIKWWLLRSTHSGHFNDSPLGRDCSKNFNCWQTVQTAVLVAAFVKCGYRLACLRVCVDHVPFVVQTMTATGHSTSYSKQKFCI
jgi:hypothetical protein